jgi:hypothetical protein
VKNAIFAEKRVRRGSGFGGEKDHRLALNVLGDGRDPRQGCHFRVLQTQENETMIRKLVIAVGATAVIAGAAMAPTTASAGWKHKHHRHGWHGGISIYTPAYFGPDCYRVRRVVLTKWGYRVRRITVCE